MATNLSILKEPIPLIFTASSCYWDHFRISKIHNQQQPQLQLQASAKIQGCYWRKEQSTRRQQITKSVSLLSHVMLKSQPCHLFCLKGKPKSFHHPKEQKNKSRYRISSSSPSANTHQPIPATTQVWDFHFLMHSYVLYQLWRLQHCTPQTRAVSSFSPPLWGKYPPEEFPTTELFIFSLAARSHFQDP